MAWPLIIRLSDGSGFVFDPARHDLVQYLVGNTPPNYPVPAIRQGFEFGRNWGTGEVVLLHWQQEAIDDTPP